VTSEITILGAAEIALALDDLAESFAIASRMAP
jgi:hypothetical protein